MDGNISVRDLQSGVTIVDVHSDLDFQHAKEIKEIFIREMNRGKSKVVGNLSHVTFVDSSGLGVLTSVQTKARAMEISFSLICPNPLIRKTMAATGLDGILKVYASEKEALLDLEPSQN